MMTLTVQERVTGQEQILLSWRVSSHRDNRDLALMGQNWNCLAIGPCQQQ
jgi:hypothetical protein